MASALDSKSACACARFDSACSRSAWAMAWCCVKVLCAAVELVGELEGVACLDIGRAQQGVVRAGDVKQRLAGAHVLTLHHHDATDWAAHLRDHRRSFEVIVFNCASEAERACQRSLFDCDNLDVRHLVGRQREQLGLGFGTLRGRERSHLAGLISRSVAAGERRL